MKKLAYSLLLCALLGLSVQTMERPAPYVRVLALNERGAAVVREARKRGSIPVLNAGQSAPDADYAELERRADALYGLFCEDAPEKPVPDSRVFVRKTDACEPLHDTL